MFQHTNLTGGTRNILEHSICGGCKEQLGFGSRQGGVGIWAPVFSSCAILGQLLNFSEPSLRWVKPGSFQAHPGLAQNQGSEGRELGQYGMFVLWGQSVHHGKVKELQLMF